MSLSDVLQNYDGREVNQSCNIFTHILFQMNGLDLIRRYGVFVIVGYVMHEGNESVQYVLKEMGVSKYMYVLDIAERTDLFTGK